MNNFILNEESLHNILVSVLNESLSYKTVANTLNNLPSLAQGFVRCVHVTHNDNSIIDGIFRHGVCICPGDVYGAAVRTNHNISDTMVMYSEDGFWNMLKKNPQRHGNTEIYVICDIAYEDYLVYNSNPNGIKYVSPNNLVGIINLETLHNFDPDYIEACEKMSKHNSPIHYVRFKNGGINYLKSYWERVENEEKKARRKDMDRNMSKHNITINYVNNNSINTDWEDEWD